MTAATATATAKAKGEEEHEESCQAGGGSSEEEGRSMHFVSPPSSCNASSLQSVTTAGMGSGETTANTSVSDKNSKSVIDAPTAATAAATAAGAAPRMHFYDSDSTDGSIVFNYRAKLQERVNNVNAGASYLRANSSPTFNIKEDSNRRQPPPANSAINKDKDSNRVLPYHQRCLLSSSKDEDDVVLEFQKEDIPPDPKANY